MRWADVMALLLPRQSGCGCSCGWYGFSHQKKRLSLDHQDLMEFWKCYSTEYGVEVSRTKGTKVVVDRYCTVHTEARREGGLAKSSAHQAHRL